MTATTVNILRGDAVEAHELSEIKSFRLFWPPADQAVASCSCGKKLSRMSVTSVAFAKDAVRAAFVSHCADVSLAESEAS